MNGHCHMCESFSTFPGHSCAVPTTESRMPHQLFCAAVLAVVATCFGPARAQWTCASYNGPNCTQFRTPICKQSTLTCYVFPNMCSGVASLDGLVNGALLGVGWTIVISTYDFQCTPDLVSTACMDEATIASSGGVINPAMCVLPNSEITQDNITITVLGSGTPRIFTAMPTAQDLNCSVFVVNADGFSVSGVDLDVSQCSNVLPTRVAAMFVFGADLQLTGGIIIGAYIGLMFQSAQCGTVNINRVGWTNPGLYVPSVANTSVSDVFAADVALFTAAAAQVFGRGIFYASQCTGSITVSPAMDPPNAVFLASSSGPSVTGIATLHMDLLFSEVSCAPCTGTETCPSTPADPVTRSIMFYVAMSLGAVLAGIALFVLIEHFNEKARDVKLT